MEPMSFEVNRAKASGLWRRERECRLQKSHTLFKAASLLECAWFDPPKSVSSVFKVRAAFTLALTARA